MTVPHMMGEILHISHKSLEPMWSKPIEITEKVDGSFVSWMLDENDGLHVRSKGKQIHEGDPGSKMFNAAIASIKERADLLVPNQVWRGEFLMKPKHNTLCYERVPTGHIAIFDIELSLGEHANAEQREEMASFLGYETVPILFEGVWDKDLTDLKTFLEAESFLGGQKIEGVVAKCYTEFIHGKPLMGKLVSEKFKEVHTGEWKRGNPTRKDIVERLIETYRVEARWKKGVQHLQEQGELEHSPRDIGKLLQEISADVLKEEEDAIKDQLFKLAWPQISRGVCRGVPEWYKEWLLESE